MKKIILSLIIISSFLIPEYALAHGEGIELAICRDKSRQRRQRNVRLRKKLKQCLSTEPAPTPTPPDFNCKKRSFQDGDLYKPVSEADKNVVVLLSSNFKKDFKSCKLETLGGTFEKLRLNNPARTNGNRQTFRSAMQCKNYSRYATLICTRQNNKCIQWQIGKDSCERVE